MSNRWPQEEVLTRAIEALNLKLGGATLQQIVDADIGFTSTSGVDAAIKRVLDQQVTINAKQVLKEEIARCDALLRTWWPKAREGDPKAAMIVVKVMDRRSKYLGLDFMDGIAERHVEVEERQLDLIAEMVRNAFGDPDLHLTPAQQAVVPDVVHRHLKVA